MVHRIVSLIKRVNLVMFSNDGIDGNGPLLFVGTACQPVIVAAHFVQVFALVLNGSWYVLRLAY